MQFGWQFWRALKKSGTTPVGKQMRLMAALLQCFSNRQSRENMAASAASSKIDRSFDHAAPRSRLLLIGRSLGGV